MFDEDRAHKLEELANLARDSGDHESELAALEAMAKMKSDLSDKISSVQPNNNVQKYQDPNSDIPALDANGKQLPYPPISAEQVPVGDIPSQPQPLPQGNTLSYVSEPAATTITGLAASALGGLAGIGSGGYDLAKQALSGQPINASQSLDKAAETSSRVQNSLTYQPKTEQGQAGASALGDVMSSPLNPLNYGADVNKYFGISDKLAEKGYPAAATAVDIGLDAASGAGIGKLAKVGARTLGASRDAAISAARQVLSKPTRMIEASQSKKADVVNRIATGTGDKDLAKIMLDRKVVQQAPESLSSELTADQIGNANPNQLRLPSPDADQQVQNTIPANIKAKVVKDPLAIETIKQGYDEGLIASLKAENPETQREALRMVNISEESKKNRKFGIDNRPADIAGDALQEKLSYIKKTKSDAGSELDKIANDLAGKPVDTTPAVNDFIADLDRNGVKLDANNNPNYTGSKFEGDEKSQKILDIIIRRAKDSSMTDAKGAHILKGFIDDKTNYGVSKEGLSGDAERIVKKFRAGIDGALDNTFDNYNQANIKYADTITALKNFQDAAGGTVDLFGPNADKALGTVSRRLLGNAQSRANLLTSLDEIDNVASKYGGNFPINVKTLADFAGELDRVHGSHASTSFLGEIEKGTATGIKNAHRDLSQTTMTGALLQGGAKAYDYLNRVTPETQYKSMKELLARGAKKEDKK